MSAHDVCVIVPTVREYECLRAYFENAREHGFDLDRLFVVLVTEDFCETESMATMLDEEGVSGEVFDGGRREAWLRERGVAEYDHLIPAASHAQTSFGLLYLWANDFEFGVFIDDDTLPHDEWDYFGRHLRNLDGGRGNTENGSEPFEIGYESGEDGRGKRENALANRDGRRAVESVRSDERWVNVLYQSETDLYPRGYPYSAMGETVETATTELDDVVVSQGLWTNVPDLDAVRILMDGDLRGQAQTRTGVEDFDRDFVVEEGQYLTVCSMNLAFRREVIPAFYQLPMDDNRWDVGRFDDIWSGVFLKRACDLLGKQIVSGFPLCEHNKAPRSTFDDLANEVAGLELNEHVWELVDDVDPRNRRRDDAAESRNDDADATTYAEAFEAMADALLAADAEAYTNGAFLHHCGEHMRDWLDCLEVLDDRRVAAVADD